MAEEGQEETRGGKMTTLEGCIRFWEEKLRDKYLMAISTAALVEQTVVFLKKLQKLEVNDETGSSSKDSG